MSRPEPPPPPAGQDPELEARWRAWLVARNRGGALASLYLSLVLYPLFGVLDYFVAPREWLVHLWGTRAAFTLVTLGMFRVIRTDFFARHANTLPAAYNVSAALGISVMTVLLGGLSSPYYAGLCLVMLAVGLLFVWPKRVVVAVQSSIVASFVVPNLVLSQIGDPFTVASNLFFLVSTAIIVGTGQVFAYHTHRQQVKDQLVIESTQKHLESANEKLHELGRSKSQFFANVSHELRTPLTLILAPVDSMLEAGPGSLEDERRLRVVQRNALRMLNLVNDVLSLVKVSEVGLAVNAAPVDVGALLAGTAADIADAATRAGLSVKVVTPESGPCYLLDAAHLERILLNLVGNALKFTPSGGLTLSVSDGESGLEITVRDTGIGIAAEQHDSVFERFRQVDGGATREHGGTGIGLALVAELTRLMGGTVALESTAGAGTRVSVRFPPSLRSQAPAAHEAEVATLSRRAALASLGKVNVEGTRSAGEHGPLVLLAEDEPELNDELVRLLSSECRVVSVRDGEAALAALSVATPDVIVSDVMMPKLDGMELASRVRQRPELRDTPFILLTALGHVDDRVRGRELGVDVYLTKPFHPRELMAGVRGALRSRMRLVGSYLLRERLGGGGQADVYRAQHLETGGKVALKIWRDTGTSERAEVRLRRERNVLSSLSHPNIPRVLEEGAQGGAFYVAMEYLDGSTIDELLRRGTRFQPADVVEIAIGTCRALRAIHEAGYVHQDVKCGNVMIVARQDCLRDAVRVIDFGLVATSTASQGAVTGTLPYLAPELLDGERPTQQSDLYALGVMMFCLATGRLPYGVSDLASLVAALHAGPSPRIRDFVPDFPPALDELVHLAMHRDVAVRPGAVAVLEAALDALPVAPEGAPADSAFEAPTITQQLERAVTSHGMPVHPELEEEVRR